MSSLKPYRGRFAPSPTGPLHFGSLIAATGSFLQAKSHSGEWLIRIDDIDSPREQTGATKAILQTLEDFGFEWDHDVCYQSDRQNEYKDIVELLLKQDLAYPCDCSRSSIQKQTGQTQGNIIYPGFCRDKPRSKFISSNNFNIRLRCNNKPISFVDVIQGNQTYNLENCSGDFILQRRDRLFSYHLASGFDDSEQNISEVVRGADLLTCTPHQLYIQQCLGLSSPQYCHLPVVVNNAGQKLSKQNLAEPINAKHAVALLYKALKFLGQKPPIELMESNLQVLWSWAKSHWFIEQVPKKTQEIIIDIK